MKLKLLRLSVKMIGSFKGKAFSIRRRCYLLIMCVITVSIPEPKSGEMFDH